MRFGLVALIAVGSAGAQTVPTLSLAKATGTLDAEFITITSVRELGDGRVLVSDPRDNRIVVGDFRTGAVRQLGRVGNGPKEYPIAFPLVATGGDTSLMINGLSKRWLVFIGDSIVADLPPESRVIAEVTTDRGVDRFGRILTTKAPPLDPRGEPINPRDSLALVFVSKQSGKVDTIGKLWMGPPRRSTGGAATSGRSFPAYDLPQLTNDGWVAVVRHEPFRVDWRSPDGRWTFGKAINVPADRVTAADKAAFLARFPESRRPPESAIDWPSEFPAAPPQQLRVTPDGKLVVVRYRSVAHPNPVYYVIDRQGRLTGQLQLDPSAQIAGFGRSSVYIAAKDPDDIVRLRRHPWP
jgi:hypothetical protein